MISETGDTKFKQKGFTIKEIQVSSYKEPIVLVDFPAYRSGNNWVKSFITEDRDVLDIIRKGFLDKYYEETGNTGKTQIVKESDDFDISDEDIPF